MYRERHGAIGPVVQHQIVAPQQVAILQLGAWVEGKDAGLHRSRFPCQRDRFGTGVGLLQRAPQQGAAIAGDKQLPVAAFAVARLAFHRQQAPGRSQCVAILPVPGLGFVTASEFPHRTIQRGGIGIHPGAACFITWSRLCLHQPGIVIKAPRATLLIETDGGHQAGDRCAIELLAIMQIVAQLALALIGRGITQGDAELLFEPEAGIGRGVLFDKTQFGGLSGKASQPQQEGGQQGFHSGTPNQRQGH